MFFIGMRPLAAELWSVTDDMIRGKHNVDMKFISRNGHYLLVGDDSGVVKVWKYDT